jgi:hypothetical protein
LISRIAYAAAHVVADAHVNQSPGSPAVLDWERTLAFRHELWRWDFGVAEAMDTAQRGMGLGWATAAELIRRSATVTPCSASSPPSLLRPHKALQALDKGDVDAYRALMEPTVPLGLHLFEAPTFHSKTGVVFLA